MIKINKLIIKNFLSVGAVQQEVVLGKNGLNLILGENLDLGGNGARNGVGKTLVANSLSYALYGQALANIRKDNLINTINKKNMQVIVEFEKNNVQYRIERGRKPNHFRWIINEENVADSESDESQGENRETQKAVEEVLGLSHNLFKNIIIFNTYTEPFLSLPVGKQREIIEELFGITQLSEKAENLRELIKATKQDIEKEQFKIATIKTSNERIAKTITDVKSKIQSWQSNHDKNVKEIENTLELLLKLDIEAEITAHQDNTLLKEAETNVKVLQRELKFKTTALTQLQNQQTALADQYVNVSEHRCSLCGQDLHDNKQSVMLSQLEEQIIHIDSDIEGINSEIINLGQQINELLPLTTGLQYLPTVYTSIDQAYQHRSSIELAQKELSSLLSQLNPYEDQLDTLQDAMQEIDYDTVNTLTTLREHQEFLLKLLTNKDSFIRKKIINQNISFLNSRLKEYATHLNLVHEIKFESDLGVDITYMGQSLDFYNLSTGEGTRLTLALNMAMRDIWENMKSPVDLLFIDELLDKGLDSAGVDKAIELLKSMSRGRNKNVFVISHREELIPRAQNILTVIKEDGFSRFDWDYSPMTT